MSERSAYKKDSLIKAIGELGRKVSVADVSTKTGLPILVVASQLNQVAAETGGHLQVSTAGDIIYRFDFGFQNVYLAHGIKRFLQRCGQEIFRIGFFLLRISFGIMLILSLLIIVLLFVAIMFSLSRGSDNDDDRGFNFNFGLFDWLILQDLFYWSPYYAQPANYQQYGRPAVRAQKKGSFLYNCFSFLFGDGDPNCVLDERRWQLVAQVIRANNGVVTAEQLAPYTDADPSNEDGVLPVLVRFDGRPEVTDSGSIVYLFPSLQVSAVNNTAESTLSTYLCEQRWRFSNLSADQLVLVGILAFVNFAGSWWLFSQSARLSLLVGLSSLLTVLVVYGTLFVFVPLLRYAVINLLNTRIDARNYRRQNWSNQVAKPSELLSQKLQEASLFKTKLKEIAPGDIVYTTDKDMLEQQFNNA